MGSRQHPAFDAVPLVAGTLGCQHRDRVRRQRHYELGRRVEDGADEVVQELQS
jgi:nitrogenase molybdenum-iron protein alpha/beta subunit